MATLIQPTVGRVLWFYPAGSVKEQAAMISEVNDDGTLNLMVLSGGHPSAHLNVYLFQDEGPHQAVDRDSCRWMPYQKGQAAKTEQLEQQQQAASAPKA